MASNDQEKSWRDGGSVQSVEWLNQQWKRYDTMIECFTTQGDDNTARKALCLAFVRSVLDDPATKRLLSDVIYDITVQMVGECEDALGREKVVNARASLLFLLWSLPLYRWKEETYEALREYCCRNNSQRPTISFKHFLGSTLRAVARYIVNPLADIIEPWI